MFKFWYEKFLIRFSFLIAFVAFLGVFVYAYFTEVTMQLPGESAPFQETLVEDNANTILPEKRGLPLEKRHRTDKELKNWASMVASESLSFNKNNLNKVTRDIRGYYTASGFRQYQEYLNGAGIINSVKQNNYNMNVYVEEPPILLNGSAIKGVYRWLYQMPVTVSFIPPNAVDLIASSSRIVNRKLTLRVQIRRINKDGDPNALAIESWTVTGRK